MLISFTGAQSTGKSTLLKEMYNDSTFRKCSFIREVTRKVARENFKINEEGNNITQLFILNEHLHNHFLNGCVFLDRCILDGFIYTKYLNDIGKVDSWVLDYSVKLLSILIDKLDIIFYTDPADVPIVDDNVRSVNVDFRNSIIEEYNKLLFYDEEYLTLNADISNDLVQKIRKKIIVLTGSVADRYKVILDTFQIL